MRRYQDVRRRKNIISPVQRSLWSPRTVYHGWRRAAYSWPVLIVLGLVFVFSMPSLWSAYGRFSTARAIRNQAASKLEGDKTRQAALENQIKTLGTEAGKEAQIRRNYQVAMPGEGVIVLVGTSTGQ